jgi:hypothetical protein
MCLEAHVEAEAQVTDGRYRIGNTEELVLLVVGVLFAHVGAIQDVSCRWERHLREADRLADEAGDNGEETTQLHGCE